MIIKYDPKTIDNSAKFLNESIEANNNEKYIMFIFNDIYDEIINVNHFYSQYVNLLKRFDLPYAFYPYYIHFNKVMPRNLSLATPKIKIKINKNDACDVITQLSYGMLIIDVEKLKSINFKFNEDYSLCFYVQELAEECLKNNLYFSSSLFLDVSNSSSMLKSSLKDGYFIDSNDFKVEKDKFYKIYKSEKEDMNKFIEQLKDLCQKIKEKESDKVELIENDMETNIIEVNK